MSDDLQRYFKPSEITSGQRARLEAILRRIEEVHRLVVRYWERYGIPTVSEIEQLRRSHA